jgi:hypothetical protein
MNLGMNLGSGLDENCAVGAFGIFVMVSRKNKLS